MSDEDFNQKIKEYLKENLEVFIDTDVYDVSSDKSKVLVTLMLGGEIISESYDYVG